VLARTSSPELVTVWVQPAGIGMYTWWPRSTAFAGTTNGTVVAAATVDGGAVWGTVLAFGSDVVIVGKASVTGVGTVDDVVVVTATVVGAVVATVVGAAVAGAAEVVAVVAWVSAIDTSVARDLTVGWVGDVTDFVSLRVAKNTPPPASTAMTIAPMMSFGVSERFGGFGPGCSDVCHGGGVPGESGGGRLLMKSRH
jgi:hypothetical protein